VLPFQLHPFNPQHCHKTFLEANKQEHLLNFGKGVQIFNLEVFVLLKTEPTDVNLL